MADVWPQHRGREKRGELLRFPLMLSSHHQENNTDHLSMQQPVVFRDGRSFVCIRLLWAARHRTMLRGGRVRRQMVVEGDSVETAQTLAFPAHGLGMPFPSGSETASSLTSERRCQAYPAFPGHRSSACENLQDGDILDASLENSNSSLLSCSRAMLGKG